MIRAKSIVVLVLGAVLLSGCVHPLSRDIEQRLRDQMASSHRVYREAVRGADDIEVTRQANLVTAGLEPDLIAKLERISGRAANEQTALEVGPDLLGQSQLKTVAMSLQRAILLAVENNRDLRLTKLVPAVRDVQITQAEAVFDVVAFATYDYQKLDTPQPGTVGGLDVFGSVQQDSRDLTVGLRKLMDTGGQLSISTNLRRENRVPSFFAVDTFYETNISVDLVQPLLRNFGSDTTRSQIMLSTNAHAQSLADLRGTMQEVVASTEEAYWQLVFNRHRLLILLRLVGDAEKARRIIEARQAYDAAREQISQIRAFVGERRLDVIESRTALRRSSDQLKQLIYAPHLPLSGEELIIPLDSMVDAPIQFNTFDAITTAFQNRPDLQRALSEIKDASIRQRVADNQRLPLLDLAASVRYNGVSEANIQEAYDNTDDGEFIDYLLSLQFEMPIGNRAAEAAKKQRDIERDGAVINYERVSQAAVLEVKTALRQLNANYESIGASHDTRLASADSVRAIQARWDSGADLTPDFVDRWIDRKLDLSRNEIREMSELAGYSTAIARYYQTIGTLLKRNGIIFSREPVEE